MVVSIKGAFFFGSSSKLANAIADINYQTIIIDISSMKFVDLTGIYALEDEILIKLEQKVKIYLVANEKQKLISLKNLLGEDKIFKTLDDVFTRINITKD